MTQASRVPRLATAPARVSAIPLIALIFGLFMAVVLGASSPANAETSHGGDAIWTGDAAVAAQQQAMSTGPELSDVETADMVLVYKGRRVMYLMRDGNVIRSYHVALGRNPFGHKNQEGDGRTPEGGYLIDWRNQNSDFHLSLHISYPRPQDYTSASAAGKDPGGAIMIHGLPNGRTADQVGHPRFDWTNGCIAVSNEEIEEIWQLVDDGTAIFILP